MDENREKFDRFCAEKGLEGTDRDYFFWLSALQTTHEQSPVAFAYFGSDGSLLQMLDFIEKGRKPQATPLYAKPMASGVVKPDIPVETLQHVLSNYYSDDLMGMLLWVQRVSKM
jgi:hypothetical protein